MTATVAAPGRSAGAGSEQTDEGSWRALAQTMISWLETGRRPARMFADDAFADLSLPHWRVQSQGAEELFGIRESEHGWPGQVRVEALDRTSRGFLLQFEERWTGDGQDWYARELIHAIVAGGLITELAIYCTGDWDESVQRHHAEAVTLLRP